MAALWASECQSTGCTDLGFSPCSRVKVQEKCSEVHVYTSFYMTGWLTHILQLFIWVKTVLFPGRVECLETGD